MLGQILIMTILIFTIISTLATVAYTFVAFKTLLEIKAQRETTYRPDIIVDEGLFYIYSYKSENGEFPIEYTYEQKHPLYSCDEFNMCSFYINLFNIGLATAREIKIGFTFDYEKIISKINEQNKSLPIEKTISVKTIKSIIKFESDKNVFGLSSIHSVDNQYEIEINHILPINIENKSIKIQIPSYILLIHSILIYNFWLGYKEEMDFPTLPIINMQIAYLDIGNNKHLKEYELSMNYKGGTQNESINELKVKQKNYR